MILIIILRIISLKSAVAVSSTPHTAFVFLTSFYGGTSVNFQITNFPTGPYFPLDMKFATNALIPEISSIQTRILVSKEVHHGLSFILFRNPLLQMTIFLLRIDVVLVPLVYVFCILCCSNGGILGDCFLSRISIMVQLRLYRVMRVLNYRFLELLSCNCIAKFKRDSSIDWYRDCILSYTSFCTSANLYTCLVKALLASHSSPDTGCNCLSKSSGLESCSDKRKVMALGVCVILREYCGHCWPANCTPINK